MVQYRLLTPQEAQDLWDLKSVHLEWKLPEDDDWTSTIVHVDYDWIDACAYRALKGLLIRVEVE